MDPIKEAFWKIKKDMDFLKNEFNSISKDVSTTRNQMGELCEIIQSLFEKVEKISKKQEKLAKNQENLTSTHEAQISAPSTHPSTVPLEIGGLKGQNLGISTGNRGASTDRQTDTSTDTSTHILGQNQEISNPNNFPNSSQNPPLYQPTPSPVNQPITVNNASEILASLDSIKKEVRLKVKRLTEQEWLIFSTIYQLEEQQVPVDYKILAERLRLTESSIRDYVGRIIKKGIPVDKSKINNKSIQLSVSPNLRQIASLSTIMQLRGL